MYPDTGLVEGLVPLGRIILATKPTAKLDQGEDIDCHTEKMNVVIL